MHIPEVNRNYAKVTNFISRCLKETRVDAIDATNDCRGLVLYYRDQGSNLQYTSEYTFECIISAHESVIDSIIDNINFTISRCSKALENIGER